MIQGFCNDVAEAGNRSQLFRNLSLFAFVWTAMQVAHTDNVSLTIRGGGFGFKMLQFRGNCHPCKLKVQNYNSKTAAVAHDSCKLSPCL